jgi:hypothetical protein
MNVALFDWTVGGHHGRYVRRFAEVLSTAGARVTVAVPDVALPVVDGLPIDAIALGAARPAVDLTRPLGPQHRALAEAEVDRLTDVVRRTRPEHVIHLYADPIIRRLVERPPLPARVSICLFFPRAHYPRAFGSPLTPAEWLRAQFQEHLVRRWRRRPDAHTLLTLDAEAAAGWAARTGGGAGAAWLPEPPIGAMPDGPAPVREGCVVYGALAPRKGLDRLARAIALAPTPLHVTLAGAVESGFETELSRLAAEMRQAGSTVDVRARSHTEVEGLAVLAGARCAVLPYPRHAGMSRVLVEAAATGTPVVAHEWGLLGHLVRTHGLGMTVDAGNPVALRAAVLALSEPDAQRRYAHALARFAARYSPAAFATAVTAALVGRAAGTPVTPLTPAPERRIAWGVPTSTPVRPSDVVAETA